MEFTKITARGAAKYAVSTVIANRVEKVAENAIADHTEIDEDNKLVGFAIHMIGWTVASQLKPLTDKAVDKAADFIAAKYAEFKVNQAKKKETSDEEK